jgi:putative DNA primase/helicase
MRNNLTIETIGAAAPCGAPAQDREAAGGCMAAALDLDKIPLELKAFPQWVCYRQNKIPVNPKTGDNAKADDPGTWGEFDRAVRHWEAHRGNGITGIGFEFSPGDPYTGVDLDKCRDPETGKIEPRALEIVRRLESYTEVSPSGTGLHIIVKATVPPGGNRKGQVEMYDSARYFTMTGHHLEGTPTTTEDRQAELEALHGEIFGKTSRGEPTQRSGRSIKSEANSKNELSDDELLEEIFKSKIGNKFRDLWQGDIDYL